MIKHSSGVVTLDGVPLSGRDAEQAKLAKVLSMVAERVHFARRGTDGALVPVPDGDVELDSALLVLQNGAAAPESIRGVIAAIASVLRSREVEATRPPDPRPAAPTPTDAARQTGIDLIRREREAEAALAAIRAARERHSHLVDVGDATGAAEIKP